MSGYNAGAFSEAAPFYDRTFSEKPHVRALRAYVQQLMLKSLPAGGTVLELGCGTGIDAAFLAGNGFRVFASDPAPGMLRTTARRCETMKEEVSLICLPAEHLASIRDRSMDGILSNFGALNCVEDLGPVIEDAYHVLRDNGIFFLVLMNRFSITEILAYLRTGRVRQAFRRWRRNGVHVRVGSKNVLTWYHSLRTIKRLIRKTFSIQEIIGLNILTPPPAFDRFYEKHPGLIAFADRCEKRIDRLPFLSALGDHMIIVLERFE